VELRGVELRGGGLRGVGLKVGALLLAAELSSSTCPCAVDLFAIEPSRDCNDPGRLIAAAAVEGEPLTADCDASD
jgi:hypothetical protein